MNASPRGSRLRNIAGGSAGNLVEWFDWYVYSAFALYFAPSFFPKGDRIRFQPANKDMEPIYVKKTDFRQTQILGLVVGVYRKMNGGKA